MDALFWLLCCVALLVPMVMGVGVSFYAEQFLGRRAYVLGWLAPILFFLILYALYHLWLRLLSCTPVDRLICGEPSLNLALVFVPVLCVVILANASAQFSLYLFRHRHDMPPQIFGVQENAVSPETPEAPESSNAAAPMRDDDSTFSSDEPTPE